MCSTEQTKGLRKMIFVCFLGVSSFVFFAHSAPTSLTSGDESKNVGLISAAASKNEKPLIRTKRAEEILYGNHQNAPRVKKSDPPKPSSDDDDADTRPLDAMKYDEKSLSTATEEKESHDRTEEGEQPPLADDQDEPASISDEQSLEDVPHEIDDSDYLRYDADMHDGSGEADAQRRKRSINTDLMTAENMISSSSSRRASLANRPVRSKRDLDYEDLRQLYEGSREGPYEEEEEPGRVFQVMPEPEEAEEEDEREEGEEEEESPIAVPVPLPYNAYEPRYSRSSDKEDLLRELVERKVEEDAREKLIDYLLASALASDAEPAEEDNDGGIVEVPGREDYDDEPLAASVAIKRNGFYPYSYEPYGGRWGAMVPGSKRSMSEYERLYRLAEALNADED